MNKIIKSVLSSHNTMRWNGKTIIGTRRSISQHHYEVAMISLQIVNRLGKDREYLKSEVLEHALTHDLAETCTSDISYITKNKYPDLKETLKIIESDFYSDLGISNNYLNDIELIVKVADIIVVAIEILEQNSYNNFEHFDMKNVDNIISSILIKYKENTSYDIYNLCCYILGTDKPWIL